MAQYEQDELHDFRKQIDACIKRSEAMLNPPAGLMGPVYAREMGLVRMKLQEAKMWVGKALEVSGSELPSEYRDEAATGQF